MDFSFRSYLQWRLFFLAVMPALFCGACSHGAHPMSGAIGAEISNDGNFIIVRYDSSDANAPVRGGARPYACVDIATECGIERRRWPMRGDVGDEGILVARFPLPSQTVGVFATVVPEGVYMPGYSMDVPALQQRDGKPVPGALPWEILKSRHLQGALEAFDKDEEAQGSANVERWAALLNGYLGNGLAPDSVLRRLDSVEQHAVVPAVTDLRSRTALAALRALCHARSGRWDSTAHALRRVAEAIGNRNECPGLTTVSILDNIFPDLIMAAVDHRPPDSTQHISGLHAAATDTAWLMALREMCTLVIRSDNPSLAGSLLRHATKLLTPADAEARAALLPAVNHVADELLTDDFSRVFAGSGGDIICTLALVYAADHDFGRVIGLVEGTGKRWDAVADWCAADSTQPVSLVPSAPLRMSLAVVYAQGLVARGDTLKGLAALQAASRRYPGSEDIGYDRLCRLYAATGQIGSAFKVVLRMEQRGGSVEHILAFLQPFAQRKGLDIRTIDDVRRMAGAQGNIAAIKLADIGMITTSGRTIRPSRLGDTLLAAIISTSRCGPCRAETPHVLSRLDNARISRPLLVLLMVPPDDGEMMRAASGHDVVLYTPEVREWFSADGFPKMLLVDHGDMIFHADDLHEPMIDALLNVAGTIRR